MSNERIERAFRVLTFVNEGRTTAEIVGLLQITRTSVENMRRLARVDDALLALVGRGKLPLSCAYQLARLPREEQANAWSQAKGEMERTIFLRRYATQFRAGGVA